MKDIQELVEKLRDRNIPEFISFLPKELITEDLIPHFRAISATNISEIAQNKDLLPFLSDFTSVPIQADLEEIAGLLSKYDTIKGEFFKDNKMSGDYLNSNDYPTRSEFKTGNDNPTNGEFKNNVSSNEFKSLKNNNNSNKNNKESTNVDEYILERISKEILETNLTLTWDDIVGLDDVKRIINEIVVWPMLRPDIFTGLRGPPKGLLLFGPPGTGKTMIGKCIASQCKATFFSISASSLTSKWVGEGEKMVRALFFLARKMEPSVIFIDEIDSLLSQRSENENEGSRRIKTEFLVQFDGVSVGDKDRILVIGATNRPQEIDEAARRRLVKRIYVALPELEARKKMVLQLIKQYNNKIYEEEFNEIARLTEGYSGSDMFNLCREASMEPLREIKNINEFDPSEVRPIGIEDFKSAMRQIRKSVSERDLKGYFEWNEQYGSMQL